MFNTIIKGTKLLRQDLHNGMMNLGVNSKWLLLSDINGIKYAKSLNTTIDKSNYHYLLLVINKLQ